MKEAFGAKPENILAGIGPGIGQCCYEVDDKVFEAGKNMPDVLRQKKMAGIWQIYRPGTVLRF